MYNFYNIYAKLCAEANIGTTEAAMAIGLSNAAASGWKKGKMPSAVNIQKLSIYFTEKLGRQITVEYLKGEEPEQKEKANNQMADGLTEEKRKAIEIIMNASDENARKYLRMIETFEGIE